VREFPAWDEPVESCTPYNHFGQSMAPSCFKLIRAFARGLRSQYVAAASELLSGPFSLCRLQAKIDRWRDAIAPFMAADTAAGLYPAKDSQQGSFPVWESTVEVFRDTVLLFHFDRFRESVSCERQPALPSGYTLSPPTGRTRGDRLASGWSLEAPELRIVMVNEMTASKSTDAAAANRGY
jgi:hypothetical protein